MRLNPMVPWWLLIVLALAVCGLLLWSSRWLLRADADRGSRRTLLRRGLLATVVLLMVAGPSVPMRSGQTSSNVEVYLLVDRTGSMAAEDWNGGEPRLNGVRQDILAIRDALPQARFSILALDSTAARELPLTSDLDAVGAWANALTQELSAKSTGSSLERGMPLLARSLVRAHENDPGDARIVYLLSDGEPTDDGQAAREVAAAGLSWETIKPLVDGGAVLGYGTAEGGKMREFNGSADSGAGSSAPYLKDGATGQDGVSKIDENALNGAATGLGLPYVHRTAPGGVESFTKLDVQTILKDRRGKRSHHSYLVWPLALVASGLIIWELAALAQAEGKLRRLAPSTRSIRP
ncbi:VWA domain-containing protein [Actinomyces trachealis]|uniref:VWA domain-containing protein n=1 Tax=Actinomyces trachealis TaxID=2763540 RepID=UPI001892BEB3|nr:VWA domain-containing protein [Actinomyces trachealis]